MISAVKTICDCVLQMPTQKPNKIALMFKQKNKWQELGWSDYYDLILAAGSALLSLGVKPQDKIAIMSNTRLEWSICDYAIMGVQAITIPVYHTITAEDLFHILSDSRAEILFIENKSMLKLFLQVRDRCPQIRKIVSFETIRDGDVTLANWAEFLALGYQEKPQLSGEFLKRSQATTRKDVATILYTSGTTGVPRGVVLTHEQIMSEVTEAFPYLGVHEDDVTLSFLPYSHILGRIEHWGHVLIGFKMAYAENIDRLRNNLLEIRPTIIVAVPRIFERIYSGIYAQLGNNVLRTKLFQKALRIGQEISSLKLDRKPIPLKLFLQYQLAQSLVLDKVQDALGGRLRFAISGGAPISKDICLFFHSCGVLLLEGYGLTETTGAICSNTEFNYHFGSVGRAIGDVQIKIAEDGEILIKSKKVMLEYHNDRQATDDAFTDGWFHTGDIGEVLSSGDLKITDRKKDLIKTAGGKYVAPQHLENLLKSNLLISHALIFGDQKRYIVALITLDPQYLKSFANEKSISYENLGALTRHPAVLEAVRRGVAESNSHLAGFETIKRFAILPEDFTIEAGDLTPSLKVKRKLLAQKWKKQIEALYK